MRKQSRQAVRAVFLAGIVIISVFAAGIAFSGSAAAEVTEISGLSADNTTAGDTDQVETVTLSGVNKTGSNLSEIEVSISDANVSVTDVAVTDSGNFPQVGATVDGDTFFTVSIPDDATLSDDITVEVTLDTTDAEPGTTGTYEATPNANADAAVSDTFQILSDSDGSQSDGVLIVDANGGSDNGSSPYATIQAAVNNAGSGDTIAVTGGSYDAVTINKPITLTVADGPASVPVINVSGSGGPAVAIEAVDVTVEGFEIVGDDSTTSGISILTSKGANTDISIKNNVIRGMAAPGGGGPGNFSFGILSFSSLNDDGATLSGVNVTGNTIENIGSQGETQGVAISLEELNGTNPGDGALVENNDINNIATRSPERPGTGIAIQPDDGSSSGAGNAAARVAGNEFSNTQIRVTHPVGDDTVKVPDQTQTVVEDGQVVFTDSGNIVVDADDGEGDFSSIQNAVDAAAPGATIVVESGIYEESVSISTKDITLEGPNAGTPGDGARSEEATVTQGVEVSADGVTVDGLEVTNDDVNGIIVTGAPSDVTVTNTVVRDIAGDTAGASKGVGNGINLQFNDAFEQTSTGIEITDNLITNITTADASGGDPDADAIGVQLLPRGNGVEDLRIEDNTIESIEPGAAPGGRSEARAVSIGTQFTNTSGGERGDLGQATNLTVAENEVSNLTADFARAVALFEDKKGAASTSDNRVGPVDFTVTGNDIGNVNSEDRFFDLAIFIGNYSNFGDDHIVQNNDFTGAAVENFGDSDALNTDGNTFSGDPKFDVHYTAANADLNSIIDSNTFDERVTIRDASVDLAGDTIFAGIQSAVNEASSDDTVSVGPGTYEESVSISTQNVTIAGTADPNSGEAATIVGQPSSSVAVEVRADGVTLDQLEIRHPTGSANAETTDFAGAVGVSVQSGNSNVTVEDSLITDIGTQNLDANPIAVYAQGDTDNITVDNNVISDLRGTFDDEDGDFPEDGESGAGNPDEGAVQAILINSQQVLDGIDSPITGATVTDNEIRNLTDTRSTVAVRFNGEVSGVIAGNDIRNLDTEGDIPGTDRPGGFTQVIDLAEGGNSVTGPRDVEIVENSISGIETTTEANFAPPTGIRLGSTADVPTIDINRNNIVLDRDPGLRTSSAIGISNEADDVVDAKLNWYGSPRGPNAEAANDVTGNVGYDPFLTTPIENIEVDDVGDTQQFAQDVVIPADQTVTAVGFPGPTDQTVGEAFSDFNGTIYEYNRTTGSFKALDSNDADREISSLEAFVITQSSNETMRKDVQVVIKYANAPKNREESFGSPGLRTIEPGFNLIAPRGVGDAYGAFNSPSDRETIYGIYDQPESDSAFLPVGSVVNPRFVESTFGPEQDDPVVNPYSGYLVFTEEERTITTYVQTGTTADEVINRLNRTAT